MSLKVCFVSTSVALCRDEKHDKIVKVVRSIDDQGRSWEQYDDGPYVLIEPPDEPESASGN